MKNKALLFFLSLSFFILPTFIFSKEEGDLIRAGDEIVRIEINTGNVDVYISTHDKNFIGYKINEKNKELKRIESFENKKKLQFYTTAVTEGEIFIYLPQNYLLDSCRIQALHSKIEVKNIKSIYFVLSVLSADINVDASKFKNVLLTTANSSLKFTSGILAVADFCLSSTKGLIEIAEEMKFCNIFMTQMKNEQVLFNGKEYTNSPYSYSPKKPKKYISLSASASNLDIKFIPPLKQPVEYFDQYGISEFGPVPPPQKVDPFSNFLPKPNK